MTKKVRVRYAPSPTGNLHIGNARTALFNYLFAKHNDGDFIIRIEDTDQKRNIENGEKSQLDNLKWLGMDWDESPEKPGKYGPYRQSERRSTYDPLVDQLLLGGRAYKCYCSEEELESERDAQRSRGEMPHYGGKCANLSPKEQQAKENEGVEPVIRFRVSPENTYSFEDMVKGTITFEASSVGGDFVIVKRDGMPTYNFAVSVDDHYMEITHVLRGDDHIANTPKQLMIYEAFGWKPPTFGHMTLIINSETGKKLSKRDESILQFIEQYRDLGYLPEAMFNFIALLGWSPVGEDEIFDQESFIKMFNPDRLSKSPAAFDPKKLDWINNQYMKQTDIETVTKLAMPHLIKAGYIEGNLSAEKEEWVKRVIELYHEQMSYGAEIVTLASLFFTETPELDEAAKEILAGESVLEVLNAFDKKMTELESFDAASIKAEIKSIQKETGIKGKNLFMPIRVAVTGQAHGPELPETIELLGREKTKAHLQTAISHL